METLLRNTEFQISLSVAAGIVSGVTNLDLYTIFAYYLAYEVLYLFLLRNKISNLMDYLIRRLVVVYSAMIGYFIGKAIRGHVDE